MTLEQATKLVMTAAAAFPYVQEKDLYPTARLWAELLSDIDYETALKALKIVLSRSKHFPSVAEIREAAVELGTGDMPTPMEAWDQVTSAIRRYGYYEQERALESLHPIVRRAAEIVGWRELCYSEEIDIIRAHFRDAYTALAERERRSAILPDDVRRDMRPRLQDVDRPRLPGDWERLGDE